MGGRGGRGECTAGYVVGGVFAAVGAEPACDGVDVDAVAAEDALLAHCERGLRSEV
jgi:hypothetical protein